MQLAVKYLQEMPARVQQHRPKVPKAVDEIIQRAIAKNSEDRYRDALSFAVDFRNACGRKI